MKLKRNIPLMILFSIILGAIFSFGYLKVGIVVALVAFMLIWHFSHPVIKEQRRKEAEQRARDREIQREEYNKEKGRLEAQSRFKEEEERRKKLSFSNQFGHLRNYNARDQIRRKR